MEEISPLKVFLGSSHAAQSSLRTVANWLKQAGVDPLKWTDRRAFPPGSILLPKLLEHSKTHDAAVFIYAEDDQILSNGRLEPQTRDNVLIEFGMFVSAMGPEKAIACRRGSPKIPIDLQGLSYVDISKNRTKMKNARIAITDWAHDLLAKAGSGVVPLAKSKATDLSDREAVLKQRAKQNRPQVRVSRARKPDSVSEAVSQTMMDHLGALSSRLKSASSIPIESLPFPSVVAHTTTLKIDKEGNCRCKILQKVQGNKRGLQFIPITMFGDIGLKLFSDLDLHVRSPTPNCSLWWERARDLPKEKAIILFFEPPVADGQRRELEVSWRWPRVFAKLAKGKVDTWEEANESMSPISEFRILLKLAAELPRIQIETTGVATTGDGKVAEVRELPPDRQRNRCYSWRANGIPGRSAFRLKLVPITGK
ncbi:MAG TPA: nucleotide-binding protein [Planctomycetaceae bacterium]|nr:nucleotide-binding protein [Planctomycetaceae bacterium]